MMYGMVMCTGIVEDPTLTTADFTYFPRWVTGTGVTGTASAN
jgi:hypothetical protein